MTVKFCSLSSGSSGNSQFIEAGRTRILVDSGFSGKRIEGLLSSIDVDPASIDYILLTHEHLDHVRGAGVLSRRYNIPLVANRGTWKGMMDRVGNIEDRNIKMITTGVDFQLRDLGVKAFGIYHDALEPVGYNIFYRDKKISILTDTGRVDMDIEKSIEGSDLYLLESNHDLDMLMNGRYPYYLKERIRGDLGHLSNKESGRLLKSILNERGEKVILGHLSQDNNNPHLAHLTISQDLEEAGLDMDSFDLGLSNRDRPTKIYKL